MMKSLLVLWLTIAMMVHDNILLLLARIMDNVRKMTMDMNGTILRIIIDNVIIMILL